MQINKPSPELEEEIIEFIFSKRCQDHHGALKIWTEDPWLAVSMYELENAPEQLEKHLVVSRGMNQLNEEEVLDLMMGTYQPKSIPRVAPGEYEFDGIVGIINKFGRLENPEDIYGEE